jgi:hypothetical protein
VHIVDTDRTALASSPRRPRRPAPARAGRFDIGRPGGRALYGAWVAYDAWAESVRLIEDGLPDRPVRLSRRRRFAPVAVDVDGDVAAAWFVRRGVACFWDDTHLLTRDEDGWRLLGGGGGSSGGPWSTEEFERARGRLPAGAIETAGGSSVRRDGGPWAGWIRAAELLVGPAVAAVVVDDRRRLAVPYHGRLVVVWAARRPPRLSARDAAGRELASRELSDIAMPRRLRH